MGNRLFILVLIQSCAVGCVHEESADVPAPSVETTGDSSPLVGVAPALAPAAAAAPALPFQQAMMRTRPLPPRPSSSPFANANRCVAKIAEACVARIATAPAYASEDIAVTPSQHTELEACFQSAASECFTLIASEADSIEEEEGVVEEAEPEPPPPVSFRFRPSVFRVVPDD